MSGTDVNNAVTTRTSGGPLVGVRFVAGLLSTRTLRVERFLTVKNIAGHV
jgi:hypothetical protein